MSKFGKIVGNAKKGLSDFGKGVGDIAADLDPGPALAKLANDIGEAGKDAVINQANVIAQASKDSGSATDNNSCRVMVIGGLVAWAASTAAATPWQAGLTAGGGAAAAQIACDRIFPVK